MNSCEVISIKNYSTSHPKINFSIILNDIIHLRSHFRWKNELGEHGEELTR